jgi:hypothetical protein
MPKSHSLEALSDLLNRRLPLADTIISEGEESVATWLFAVESIEARLVLANIMTGDEWPFIRHPKLPQIEGGDLGLDDFDSASRWCDEFILEVASKSPLSAPDFDYIHIMQKLTRFKSDLINNPTLSLFCRKISSSMRSGGSASLPHVTALPNDDDLLKDWYKLYTLHGVLTGSATFQKGMTDTMDFKPGWIGDDSVLLILLISYTIKSEKTNKDGFASLRNKLAQKAFKDPAFNAISEAISTIGR